MQFRKLAAGILAGLTAAATVASGSVRAQTTSIPQVALDDPIAPFVESRAYARAHGATAEWTKMEGSALDPVNRKLYIAVSSVTKGMSDAQGDLQLPGNKCGAVYVADLDASWNIPAIKPLLEGGPYNAADQENPCNVNNLANPDNIFVDPAGNVWIGEDTEYHANNYLWVWNGKELKRFASVPRGAEVTGLRVTADGTVFMNTQHPGAMNIHPYNRGTIGVVTGYKAGRELALDVPTGDDARRVMVAAGQYQVLGRVGEPLPGDLKGEHFGQPTFADGTFALSNNPDGNMFLPTNAAGTEGYLYTNIEARPGVISKLYVRQTAAGSWQVLEGENVDLKSVGGGWNFCNATVTPWNTGLTSEEYEPAVDARWAETVSALTAYLGRQANPYDYGYNVELIPDGTGTRVVKHYAMGRLSQENASVMPDERTVYETDDYTGGVLFKFVADAAGDLSAGTLYAAKLAQVSMAGGLELRVTWVELGHGNDQEIAAGIRAIDARLHK